MKRVVCCDTCISNLFLETSRKQFQGPFKVMAILHHSTEQILAGFMRGGLRPLYPRQEPLLAEALLNTRY